MSSDKLVFCFAPELSRLPLRGLFPSTLAMKQYTTSNDTWMAANHLIKVIGKDYLGNRQVKYVKAEAPTINKAR